jgi:hypothetical protein
MALFPCEATALLEDALIGIAVDLASGATRCEGFSTTNRAASFSFEFAIPFGTEFHKLSVLLRAAS